MLWDNPPHSCTVPEPIAHRDAAPVSPCHRTVAAGNTATSLHPRCDAFRRDPFVRANTDGISSSYAGITGQNMYIYEHIYIYEERIHVDSGVCRNIPAEHLRVGFVRMPRETVEGGSFVVWDEHKSREARCLLLPAT